MLFLSFSQPFAELENVFWDNVIQFKKTSNISLFLVRIKSDEACVEFRDTDIIKALVDIILPCHIALEGSDNIYKGTKVAKYVAFWLN